MYIALYDLYHIIILYHPKETIGTQLALSFATLRLIEIRLVFC